MSSPHPLKVGESKHFQEGTGFCVTGFLTRSLPFCTSWKHGASHLEIFASLCSSLEREAGTGGKDLMLSVAGLVPWVAAEGGVSCLAQRGGRGEAPKVL